MDEFDIKYMKLALKEAKKAYKKGEVPIGAVIVKNNRVIAKAYNLKETKNNATCHAEILAINKACRKIKNWRLIDCTIYITMFPCPMCASAISQSRISKVVCGAVPEYVDKPLIKKILNDKNYGLPAKIVDNVLVEECLNLLKKFFTEKRR